MTFPDSKKSKTRYLAPKVQLPVIITGSTQNKENGDFIFLAKQNVRTGMEREEEKEHHLQVAMESQNMTMKGDLKASTSIPIRKCFEIVSSTLTKSQKRLFCERSNTNLDAQVMKDDCYDLDERDAEWLEIQAHRQINISWDEFEKAVDVLESNSRKTILNFAVFISKCPKIDRQKLTLIYDYWLDKRKTICRNTFHSASLIPIVPDNDDFIDDSNPYIAFRKRETGFRRRSARNTSFHTLLGHNTTQKRNIQTDEEKEIERLEHLDKLQYQVNTNSELDGRFAFKRNKYCIYKTPENFTFDSVS